MTIDTPPAGTYYIVIDAEPVAERIRLSRHPAALILEGIRRKLDCTCLERLIGPPSTVIEVRDRERLGGIGQIHDAVIHDAGIGGLCQAWRYPCGDFADSGGLRNRLRGSVGKRDCYLGQRK